MNIIRPSNSPWSSPLHMVAKPSGGWRACADYRALNAVSEDDRYPMPHLQDFAINLEGKQIFSKIDLVRAYNQVPMNAADIAKTAIVTPFGLFVYIRMPFGLKNAAQTFQRCMDRVFRDLPFVYIYLDDILIASNSPDEHRKHLRQLFERLADFGLVVNPTKCVLGKSSLEFICHCVTSSGVRPLQERVQHITYFPRPQSTKSLKAFLGMLNFYRRFVPQAAAILNPFYDLVNVKDGEFEAAWTFTNITFNAVNWHWPRRQASRIRQRQQRPASTQMRQIPQWMQCYNSVYTEFGRPYRFSLVSSSQPRRNIRPSIRSS